MLRSLSLLVLLCGSLMQPRFLLAAEPVVVITSFSSEVSRFVQQQLAQHRPELDLRFINKKTAAVLTHLEKNLYPRPDLVIMSAPDAFDWLSQQGQLRKLSQHARLAYTPFAYSGYGLMLNQTYLQQHQLSPPQHWEDLLRPEYRGHIAMSTPSRSGTTHVMVETLLQEKGWHEGWAYLLTLSGNLSTITARSFGVRQGVINQRFGLGLTIDFFAFTARYQHPQIGFVYPSPSAFLPVSAGLVKGGAQPEAAEQLIRYLLSPTGQKMLLAPQLSRFPVEEQVLAGQPDHLLNQYQNNIGQTLDYDSRLAVRRYQLVNALFDELITLRLDFMQQSWASLQQIRKQLQQQPDPELSALYQVIEEDLLSVPFAEIRLGETELLQSFAQVLPGAQLAAGQQREMDEWRQWSREQQDRINHLIASLQHQLGGASRGSF
ncbi:ABC transporter substrate-binding protein [Neptuniibacter halophilus]|uniref:ABC transporter substrate-binding protein n=1 Tax=Neptuniibacter halophilus TaxID=651666 RepID=UPI0025727D56|nr:extracellular solute-binding protein [Neptuniibacter halophilus]